MRGDDARDALGLGLGFPDVAFISAADDDPVGARKHIAGLAGEGIADLGLRDQDRELAAERDQFHVAEQLARAEPGAVEDQSFGERRDLGGRNEAAPRNTASRARHTAPTLAERTGRLALY